MHKKQTICFQLETQFNIQRCTLHFPFTNNICTSKYNHLIEPKVEGQKVTSQPTIEETKVFEQEQINKELEEELDVTLNFLRITTTSIAWKLDLNLLLKNNYNKFLHQRCMEEGELQ